MSRKDMHKIYSYAGIKIRRWRDLKKAAESSLALDESGPMYLLPLVAKRVRKEIGLKNAIITREIAYKEIMNIEKESAKKYCSGTIKNIEGDLAKMFIENMNEIENIFRSYEKSIYKKLFNLIYKKRKLKYV